MSAVRNLFYRIVCIEEHTTGIFLVRAENTYLALLRRTLVQVSLYSSFTTRYMDQLIISQLEAGDYQVLFNVIEKNRDRLLTYFPKTSGSITNIETARRYTESKARQAALQEQYFFTIRLQELPQIIGGLILKNIDWTVPKGELAYFIDGDYEGKGITTYAVKWLVDYAFNTLQFEKLYVKFNPENLGSKKIAIKNGFKKEGLLRNEYRTGKGLLVDVERYGLLKSENLAG